MIKKFNFKTKGLLDVDPNKAEGIKFSKNINEFRKQIINSYNDQVIPKDVKKGKINYNNALTCLEKNDEKRIKRAEELEKEFYKVKYNENKYLMEEKLSNKYKNRNKEKSLNAIDSFNPDVDKSDENSIKKIKKKKKHSRKSPENKKNVKNMIVNYKGKVEKTNIESIDLVDVINLDVEKETKKKDLKLFFSSNKALLNSIISEMNDK